MQDGRRNSSSGWKLKMSLPQTLQEYVQSCIEDKNIFSHPFYLALHMLKTAGEGSTRQEGRDPSKEIILAKGYMQSIKHKIQIKRNGAKCKALFLP